jgi:NDP-sugar pyrophosphorylase family protein
MRPLTIDRPKPMLPVAGRPLLEITVSMLRAHNVTDLAINLHHRPDAIIGHFGDGADFGVSITYSNERHIMGTAGAAKQLEWFLDDTFLVVYGDVLTNLDYTKLVKFHRSKRSLLTLSLYRVSNPTEVGLVGIDVEGRVTRFLEKPRPDEVFTDLANSGILVCEPEVLSLVPPDTFFDFGCDLLPALLESGEPLHGLPLVAGEYLIDIGTPENYERAQREWPAIQDRRTRTAASLQEE